MGHEKFDACETYGIMPPMTVALFHDRVGLRKLLAERGKDADLLKDVEGQTFHLKMDGETVHFVLVDDIGDIELHRQLALLAHEAVHVALAHLGSLGEEDPAEEELAYAVQAACGCLFDMHLAHVDGRLAQ